MTNEELLAICKLIIPKLVTTQENPKLDAKVKQSCLRAELGLREVEIFILGSKLK